MFLKERHKATAMVSMGPAGALAVAFSWSHCSTSPPGGNQVDGLPPVSNSCQRNESSHFWSFLMKNLNFAQENRYLNEHG